MYAVGNNTTLYHPLPNLFSLSSSTFLQAYTYTVSDFPLKNHSFHPTRVQFIHPFKLTYVCIISPYPTQNPAISIHETMRPNFSPFSPFKISSNSSKFNLPGPPLSTSSCSIISKTAYQISRSGSALYSGSPSRCLSSRIPYFSRMIRADPSSSESESEVTEFLSLVLF